MCWLGFPYLILRALCTGSDGSAWLWKSAWISQITWVGFSFFICEMGLWEWPLWEWPLWSFDRLSSDALDTMGNSQIIVIVLSSIRTGGERVWMPSPLRRIIIERRFISSSSHSLILCLVQKPGFDGLNYLILGVGFSAWAWDCWKQLMGERFWIEPQRPLLSFPGCYLCCREGALWLGSENHTCLTECSSVPGCSWKLRCSTLTRRGSILNRVWETLQTDPLGVSMLTRIIKMLQNVQ